MPEITIAPDASVASSAELKPLPEGVRAALEGVGVNGDAVLQLQTDIDAKGRFGERYLVATPQKLVVVSNNGSVVVEREVALSEINAIESRGMAGSASLEARLMTPQGEQTVELVRGSNSRAREMSQVATKLTQLRDNGTLKTTHNRDAEGEERVRQVRAPALQGLQGLRVLRGSHRHHQAALHLYAAL